MRARTRWPPRHDSTGKPIRGDTRGAENRLWSRQLFACPAGCNVPRISVLVPTYNREKTIEACLRSALDAPFRDLEVLVADNASTDGTVAIVERIAADDERVKLVVHGRNLGPVPNWKSLLERASAPLVHWLWSDDLVEPAFYGDMLDGMARHGAQLGVCAARIFDDEEGWTQITGSLERSNWPAQDYLRVALRGSTATLVSPCAALLSTESCRRHFYDAIPGRLGNECVRRAVGPDALLILGAALDAERVYVQGEPLVRFRHHTGSITASSGNALDALYAYARLWWSRKNGLPIAWGSRDAARLAASGRLAEAFLPGSSRT